MTKTFLPLLLSDIIKHTKHLNQLFTNNQIADIIELIKESIDSSDENEKNKILAMTLTTYFDTDKDIYSTLDSWVEFYNTEEVFKRYKELIS